MPTAQIFVSHAKHWYKAVTGSLVAAISLIVEHATGRPLSWSWFVALFMAGLAWQFYEKSKNANDGLPNLYLEYDPQPGNWLDGASGLFLKTEEGKIASSVRMTSPDFVGLNHTLLRMRWTNPHKNIGSQPEPVQVQCMVIKNGQETTAVNSISKDQLEHLFKLKQDKKEFIVTITYTDVVGKQCTPRRFRIWQDTDPLRTVLKQGRIFCEPIKDEPVKDQAAS